MKNSSVLTGQKASTIISQALQDVRSIRGESQKLSRRLEKVERGLQKLTAEQRPRPRVGLNSLAESLRRTGDSMCKALAIHMLYHREISSAEMYVLMRGWRTKQEITPNEVRNVVSDANDLLRQKGGGKIKAVVRGAFKWRGTGAIGQHAEGIRRQLSRAKALLKKDPVKAVARLSDLVKRHRHYLDAVLALAQCLTATDQRVADVRLFRRVKTLLSDHELTLSPGLDSLAIRSRDDPQDPLWKDAAQVIAKGSIRLKEMREARSAVSAALIEIERSRPETKKLFELLDKIKAFQAIPGGVEEDYQGEYERALADITRSGFYLETVQPMLEETFRERFDSLQRRSLVAEVLLQTAELTECPDIPTFTRVFGAALSRRISEEIAQITAGMGIDDFRLARELENTQQRMKAIGVESSRERILKDRDWDEPTLQRAEKALLWLKRKVE